MRKHLTPFARFAALILLASGATAQNVAPDQGYATISPAQPTTSGNKIEVIEVFSYGCIHCAQFQPYVDEWRKKADKNTVQFTYLPATFNAQFKLLARAYYAAESLGVVDGTHQRVFNAIFIEAKRVQTLDDIVALYASFGVDANKFRQAAQSFYTESQLRRADELMRNYQIDGTPSVIVAGKYRVTGESASGNEKIFTTVDKLIAKEKPAKAPAKSK